MPDQLQINPQAQLFAPALGKGGGRGRLEGRRILIVGAGQRGTQGNDIVGNGRAMSLLFAREGAHVACVDRDPASCEDTVAMIAAEGGRATAIACDASEEQQVADMIARASCASAGSTSRCTNSPTMNGWARARA